LTALGIIIGIAAIISLISLGDSMKLAISDQLNQLGSDKIIVTQTLGGGSGIGSFGPPRGSGESLRDSDLKKIQAIPGVQIAMPVLVKSVPVTYKSSTRVMNIVSFSADDADKFFSDIQQFELESGRFLNANDRSAIVIGSGVINGVFDNNPKLLSKIQLNGKDVRVVGILKSTGNSQWDSGIMTTIETLRDAINGTDEISLIMIKSNGNVKEVSAKVEDVLDKAHGDDIYTAMTTEQIGERITKVFVMLTFLLSGIAAISLLVAGFGIMNTMLMSVMEGNRSHKIANYENISC